MNNLIQGDYVVTKTHLERLLLIEELSDHGLELSGLTWTNRHRIELSKTYPVLVMGVHLVNGRTSHGIGRTRNGVRMYNELTMGEFLMKAGIGLKTSHRGNTLKHYFI
jgi:hypothetical protein